MPAHAFPPAQPLLACGVEQDIELADGDKLSQDHRDRHKQDQVPRLIAGEQFHIVGHCHFHNDSSFAVKLVANCYLAPEVSHCL